MECSEPISNSVESCNGGLGKLSNDVKENDNPDVDLLEDFDSYWEDLNERLTISRMVNDSVIKGMVSAVTQDAEEKIANKELEVTKLKEMLHVYHVGFDENELLPMQQGSKGGCMHDSFHEAAVEYDRVEKYLGILRVATQEQFKKLKKETDSIRGCYSVKRINSNSQLMGLSDILQDKVFERCIDVDRSLDTLKSTIETVYQQVEQMVSSSKASFCEWQQDQEYKAEIEVLVMRNCIWDIEKKNCDQSCDDRSLNWHVRMKEISSLREELDTISKSLSVSDTGLLSSYGSLGSEEEIINYKDHHSHLKALNNLKSSPSLPSSMTSTLSWEENGKHDESEIQLQESLDPNRLTHLSRDELIIHCNNEMTKLKRNHESQVLNWIEEKFSLRRELLRGRGSSLPSKKNKELDMLRRKICEVISKLDEVLVEKEEVAAIGSNDESLSSLKERLESLLSENHQLRELLTDKEKEVKCLSLQVSEAVENMSEHSLTEAKLLKTTANLKSAVEDAHIEALIVEDTFACILRGIVEHIKCISEDSHMENCFMQEFYKIISKEAAQIAQPASQYGFEDLNMEQTSMQELCLLIFTETVKDAEQKLNDLNLKYIDEKEHRVLVEREKVEIEKKIEAEVATTERLKQKLHSLEGEKEQLEQDAVATLENEKARYELAAQELNNLREETRRQEKLIAESIEESNTTKHKLILSLEHIERHKTDICKLDQKLELAVKELGEVNEEKRMLLDVNREKQNVLSLFEAKEKELNEQLESTAVCIHGLLKTFTDFEHRITQDISGNCLRLKSCNSQLHFLKQKANVIVRRGLLYQQKFEKKCSDLEKAEAEVDLLGDEVDTLLSLVEKIYIGLDHYSPVLKHYPGITEILKLIRTELNGESKTA